MPKKIRYHGVFAPNSEYRALVTPGKRGKGRKIVVSNDTQAKSPEERRVSMNYAQRLKRFFDIDVELCDECGGAARITCLGNCLY